MSNLIQILRDYDTYVFSQLSDEAQSLIESDRTEGDPWMEIDDFLQFALLDSVEVPEKLLRDTEYEVNTSWDEELQLRTLNWIQQLWRNMKGEPETRAVLQHMYERNVITKKELDDMNSFIDGDGVFAAHAGISAVVESPSRDVPADVLDEILALKPFFDEEYYQDILDAIS